VADPTGPTIRERIDHVRVLDEAGEALREAMSLVSQVLLDVQSRSARVDELEWLVGMLAVHVQPGTLMPPRLAPIVRECAERYVDGGGSARYTVAVPVQDVTGGARPQDAGGPEGSHAW
jgi:hypothetical protein